MKREEIIKTLAESAASNLTIANALERNAENERKIGELGAEVCIALDEAQAERYRWFAGCGMATINHLNGVSPE